MYFELDEGDGAIIFRADAQEELSIPEIDTDDAARIRSAVAFFLYAVQREDWIEEFTIDMETLALVESMSEEEILTEEEEKKQKKCHLRLVK